MSRFTDIVKAQQTAQRLSQMPPPLTLGSYNRRLTYAKQLLERGQFFSAAEIKEPEYHEDRLPQSQADYTIAIVAVSLWGFHYYAARNNALDIVGEAIEEVSAALQILEEEVLALSRKKSSSSL